ncbi:putative Blue copper protein precursor [Hibiscus syriacus]|uniref:Blue copper protein n=1 Tax=Hibiscus syriacus TaxID=106335 RepID=A0A6A3CZN1_HIBSY|nr:flavanone 3-dioxygenase 3 [Hibiscus syriacus]KAE8735015.1 putative Blue copper protein precursor [Hibiscus syriacus]
MSGVEGSFTTGNTAQELGFDHVPECYVVSPSKTSSSDLDGARVTTVDMSRLRRNGEERSVAIKELGEACRRGGFFQVVNHGICQSILDEALAAAVGFFDLPAREKLKFKSSDVYKPVRYSTSLKDGVDKVQFWRIFLKHYAHPLDAWIDSWPDNPPHYREKMGKYCAEVRKLALELMGTMIESLAISPNHLSQKLEHGMQVVAVNCYPPCPEPNTALGLPPHSDYSCLTIILQNSTGLEFLDTEDGGNWIVIPEIRRTLQVHVGDHFEVLSNGIYKSAVHRATLNSESTRISIASLHSLGMDDKMEAAEELVDEQNPQRYRESSFRDFLDFLASDDIVDGKRFIDTLRA